MSTTKLEDVPCFYVTNSQNLGQIVSMNEMVNYDMACSMFVIKPEFIDENGDLLDFSHFFKDSVVHTVSVQNTTGKFLRSCKNFPKAHNIKIASDCLETLEGLDVNFKCYSVYVAGAKIKNFKGCPKNIGYALYAGDCHELESVEGHPESVARLEIKGCENIPYIYKEENKWVKQITQYKKKPKKQLVEA